MPRVTIEEVAAQAGVSVATVSRALRGLPNVSPATRDRVVATASELNYRPDPNAARLAAGHTKTIAVGVVAIPIWYTGQVVSGIEAVLTSRGYDLTLLLIADSDVRRRSFGDVGGGVSKRADGAIIVDLLPTEDERETLSRHDLRWVMVGADCPEIDSVVIDNRKGAEAATRHLLDLGHRRIGLIAGGPPEFPAASPALRRAGYEDALRAAGIEPDPRCVEVGDFSTLGGYEAMQSLLDAREPPTAVFAMSDEMAMGAIRACSDAGLDVPGHISVVGFDDIDTAFAFGLTTVRQDPAELGAVAARSMVERLEGFDGPARRIVVPTSLTVRSSTAAPGGW